MGDLVGALAIGLMVIVLAIAIFSLVVTATIPIGRILQRRRDHRAVADDTPPSGER